MLIAPAKPAEPEWKSVMGAQVLFAPIDRPMLRRARRAAAVAIDAGGEAVGDDAAVDEQFADLGDALSLALLMAGVIDWRDVFTMSDDEDTGEGVPLPCTDEAKARLFADPLVFEQFDAAYVVPFATRERERAAPGKGSPLSPNGTSAREKEATGIAPSPAKVRAAAATSAPTSSRKRNRKLKKPSGAS
ncbi:hypothetical protein [uncultured Sphingomonas sp.]|uniref:hypothetical protein n=1 Tax=uncultured Sphingomonas sp. TaxID=158754 RepID=UPI0025D1FA7E|nr:hypothetical protein [uncultured Sphingomonas sp.]